MYMEWDQFFLKKDEWQRESFEMIKNDLICTKNNRFVRYENTKETHLVTIYGKSQVGKTTLILNMIGLKPERFSEVYETLRAGVPRGNSSTSTAIIYSKSTNNQYGFALTSINSITREIQHYDKKGMIIQLDNIRQQVENNIVSSNNILYVYIPKKYFIHDSTTDSISIMDMPGIESRNHREDIHVQSLMTKFIPISSVCIIACRSNEIQSLETLVLPNHMEWKNMEHRFILVITHAYNDGTTKQYFITRTAKHTSNFYDYVNDSYKKEIRKILGENNRTEVYPIDVGDSLTKLCNDEIKNKNDRKEIIDTKDRVLADLRKSIIGHKGEKLKSALMDLKIIIKNYGEDEIQRIDNEITDLNTKKWHKNNMINCTIRDIEKLSDEYSEQEELVSEIKELERISDQFKSLLSSGISELYSKTKRYILKETLYSSGKDGDIYLKDNKQDTLSFMRDFIFVSVEHFIKNLNDNIRKTNIDIILNPGDIEMKAYEFILEEQNSIYPKKQSFFSKKEKVSLKSLETICNKIQENINIYFKKNYTEKYINEIKTIINEKKQEINRISAIIRKFEHKKHKYQMEIITLESEILELHKVKKDIEQKREQDLNTLNTYLEYAKKAYIKQRNNIVLQINETRNTAYKFLLILFLGVLDKDYQKVTGGIHENDN